MMRTPLAVLAVAVTALAASSGCSFLEAFEIVYGGEGKYRLDPLETELAVPKVEDLGNLSPEELAAGIPGLPDSKSDFTLAHAQGALKLAGDCSVTGKATQAAVKGKIDPERTTFTVTACEGDARCASLCEADAVGLGLTASVRMQFISEKKAADIKKNLSDVSADAINQFRLRFSRLEAFQRTVGPDGQVHEEVTTGLFHTFSFRVRDVAGNEEEVLDRTYVERISEATPQRFDLPVSSPVVRGIATDLLAGKAVSLDMIVTTFVAQEDLYRVRIEGAGIRVKAQPELVISALDSVGSQL